MTTTPRAVLYCRSSKDRHDISIDVQRRELTDLARARGYIVAGEFADVVESGKDEDRPGLQALLADLYKRDRTWTIVLALDTSRIARRAAAAYWFEDRECRPRGVTVIYKNLPDMDEAERAIVKAVFHGVDEWHSLVSKRKGLAGMRENVRSGFRAGGRAPKGYRLEHVATGAVREGAPVLKSKLVPNDDAQRVAGFLRDRSMGLPRVRAARKNGLDWPSTTLLSLERNALTYAGHTVWNQMNEKGHVGGRFRPRAEWEIKRDTHAALITEPEAEAILEQLSRGARKTCHQSKREYLLGGLLRTPDGRLWHGDGDKRAGNFYRHGKARRILARRVDEVVMSTINEDLAGGELARKLLEHMRAHLVVEPDLKRLAITRRRVDELDRKIRKLADLAAEADVATPLLRTIGTLETEREQLEAEAAAIAREAATQRQLRQITEEDVQDALRCLAVDLGRGKEVDGLRDQLMRLVERVELDPERPVEVVLRYRLPMLTGVSLASPQRPEEYPGGELLERRVPLAA